MKICIDGLSLDQYKRSSYIEEFNIFLENQQFINYNESDDLITPLIDDEDLAMEDSMAWDMVKGAWKGTKGTIKAGVKGYGEVNRQWTKAKNRWADIKPRILKMVREFGQSLQNLWHKYMKYDQKYKELGQKIQQIIRFSVTSLTELPPVTFNYHHFNVKALLDTLEYIKSYDVFFNTVFDPSKNIFGSTSKLGLGQADKAYTIPMTAIENGNLQELQSICDELSQVIANLSDAGDVTIVQKLFTALGYKPGLFFNKSSDKLLNANQREQVAKNEYSASEYTKLIILGEQITKTYNNENLQEFKTDMVGNGGFLQLVASMVNNNVLSGALRSSGETVKKETDKMMKAFNEIMQKAEKKASENAAAKAKAEAESQANTQSQNNVDANLKTNSAQTTAERNNAGKTPEFKSLGDEGDIEEGAGTMTIDGLAELYTRNMTILFTKIAATYQMIIKGVLAATYQIISEADEITYLIERQTQVQKGQVK